MWKVGGIKIEGTRGRSLIFPLLYGKVFFFFGRTLRTQTFSTENFFGASTHNITGLKSMLIQFQTSRTISCKVLVFSCPGQLNRWPYHSLTQSETFDFSVYNDYNDYNDSNDRDSDLDLDLDWGRFSELVTELTITSKCQNINHDIA